MNVVTVADMIVLNSNKVVLLYWYYCQPYGIALLWGNSDGAAKQWLWSHQAKQRNTVSGATI